MPATLPTFADDPFDADDELCCRALEDAERKLMQSTETQGRCFGGSEEAGAPVRIGFDHLDVDEEELLRALEQVEGGAEGGAEGGTTGMRGPDAPLPRPSCPFCGSALAFSGRMYECRNDASGGACRYSKGGLLCSS